LCTFLDFSAYAYTPQHFSAYSVCALVSSKIKLFTHIVFDGVSLSGREVDTTSLSIASFATENTTAKYKTKYGLFYI
jgi:hypothetical protein